MPLKPSRRNVSDFNWKLLIGISSWLETYIFSRVKHTLYYGALLGGLESDNLMDALVTEAGAF